MKLVSARDGQLHLVVANTGYEKTYCGKNSLAVNSMNIKNLTGGTTNGHSYGEELLRSTTCKQCKMKARADIKQHLYYYNPKERKAFYNDVFKPFTAPRPLPKKSSIGGVNKLMANVRERCRKKSKEAQILGRLWTVRTTNIAQAESTLETWDAKAHAAFMYGVNFAINEVFAEFKLEKYDKFRDQAYAEMHEIITGEPYKDERNDD
jgi:hypothetical protein